MKNMEGKILLLGTGSSAGVPAIGCHCFVCRSKDERNRRLRTSGWVTMNGEYTLIDVTPDFRQQALLYNLPCPNHLLITHTHYDHIGGLEELRAYTLQTGKPIFCYLSERSYESVKKLFYYHFLPKHPDATFSALFSFQVLPGEQGSFFLGSIPVQYFTYYQGNMPVTGFIFGSMAYVTDIKTFDPSIISLLDGIETLFISAIRQSESHVQMSLKEALFFAAQVHSKRTYCIHMSHEMDFEEENAHLPQGVFLGFDGMEVSFSL